MPFKNSYFYLFEMENDDNINWVAKCEVIKKKYKELVKLRQDNVKLDIISLNAQLVSARDIHEIAMNEIKQQIIEKQNENKEIEYYRQKIQSLIKSNQILIQKISAKNPNIGYFIRNDNFNVQYVNSGLFKVQSSQFPEWVFSISKQNQDNSFQYDPIRIPSLFLCPNWIRESQKIKSEDMISFPNACLDVISQFKIEASALTI